MFLINILFYLYILSISVLACRWAMPNALLSQKLIFGRQIGFDKYGNWHGEIVFNWHMSMQHFEYKILASTPGIQNKKLGFGDFNKNETILQKVMYRPPHHFDHVKVFSIEVGVSSDCLKHSSKILVSAMYTIDLEECFNTNDIFVGVKERTSSGWLSNATLVFFPDVYHYSCLHVEQEVDTQRFKMNSTLKLLTDENNKCAEHGGCLAIANIYLNRTFIDDGLVDPNSKYYELMTNVSVSYAVSMFVLRQENSSVDITKPVDFDITRRSPVSVNNSYDLRYDICEATECFNNTRCVSNRFKNDALMHDLALNIKQEYISSAHFVSATCSFEPFAYVDGLESPFIYVRSWFKYETSVSDTPYWWCPPDLKARITKVPLNHVHTRRLSFL